MSRNLEWVYRSAGRELNTAGLTVSLSDTKEMVFDGEFVWVSNGLNGIAIYQYAGENSLNEPAWDTLSIADYQRFDYGDEKKLRLVTIIKITETEVIRSTILKDKSVFPTLQATDPDGTYGSGPSLCTVTTVDGQQVITTSFARTDPGTAALNATHVAVGTNNRVYVTNGMPYSEVFAFNLSDQNISTTPRISFSETIDGISVPRMMSSNILFADGKLWSVAARYDDVTPQNVTSFAVSGGAVVNIALTARPGTARSWLANGFNGHVYVTNFNNLSVSKVTYAGALASTIRVNSSPMYVYGFADQRIYVSSFAGMLSLVDWDDDSVQNDWGTEGYAVSLNIDPTDTSRLWFCRSGAIVRHELNTQDQVEITLEDDDWVFNGRVGTHVFEGVTSAKRGDTQLLAGKLQSNTITVGDKTYHRDLRITNTTSQVLVEHEDYTVENSATGTTVRYASDAPRLTGTLQTVRLTYFFQAFAPRFSVVTPERTYSSTEGTITVKPHLIFLSSNCIFAIRLEDRLTWMPIEAQVNGQAAVAGGTRTEFGD